MDSVTSFGCRMLPTSIAVGEPARSRAETRIPDQPAGVLTGVARTRPQDADVTGAQGDHSNGLAETGAGRHVDLDTGIDALSDQVEPARSVGAGERDLDSHPGIECGQPVSLLERFIVLLGKHLQV